MSPKTRHKIGCARTIRTAILAVEYLRQRYHSERFEYVFTNPTPDNGWWSADITLTTWGEENIDKLFPEIVSECRAFIAGAGEIWT